MYTLALVIRSEQWMDRSHIGGQGPARHPFPIKQRAGKLYPESVGDYSSGLLHHRLTSDTTRRKESDVPPDPLIFLKRKRL